VRPDDVVTVPVLRVVGVPPARAGADQDLVHLMAGLLLLRLVHLGADHGLHEAMDLQRVAPRVYLDQREPADVPDHLTEDELLAQRLVEGQ